MSRTSDGTEHPSADLLSLLEAERARAEFHQRNLEALLSLSETISRAVSLDEVFQSALTTAIEITRMNSGGIRVLDLKAGCFRLMAHQGMTPLMVRELTCIPIDKGFPAEAAASKKPAFTANLPADSRIRTKQAAALGYQSLVCVPLLADGLVKGTMELADKKVRNWEEADLRWLASIGREIGAAVHVVELSERTRDFAVLQERERLSRELHDGLAQTIGAIRLWAETAQLALEDGDSPSAQQGIRRIEAAASEAYLDLREEILGLRNAVGLREGLLLTLQEYLTHFEQHWKISTSLNARTARGGSAAITPDAEIQLLRIIQEALTNVRRHAQATCVTLTIEEREGWLSASVEDNGCGFDPDACPTGHLGLRVMRERAASVGGNLSIVSFPGQGTCIQVDIPHRLRPRIGY